MVRRARVAAKRRQFLAELAEGLHDTAHVREYRFDSHRFSLVQEESAREVALAPAFERYLTGGDREKVFAELRRQLMVPPVPQDFARAAPYLCLRVCSRAAEEICLLAGPSDQGTKVLYPLSEVLALGLFYESRAGRFACTALDLKRWGVPADRAIRVAGQHAGPLASDLFDAGPGGVRIAHLGARLGGALWRSHELLKGLFFVGSPIAMIVGGAKLLLADSGDTGSLAAMVELARKLAMRDELPMTALRWGADGWVRYVSTDENFPAELRALELPPELRAFERQRKLLQALYARERNPIRVVAAEAPASGGGYTFCRWVHQGDLLLPVTDRIQLPAIEGHSATLFEWRDVMPKLGGLVETLPLLPARVRVRQLPPLGVLQSLYDEALRSYSLDPAEAADPSGG